MRKLGIGAIIFCSIMLMGSGIIYLDALNNYANQYIPPYITQDNTGDNHISDEVATLGRVLFYDKNMSVDNRTACASCHQQDVAFSDPDQISTGSVGLTGRHSMRLINSRFSEEERFFWDERAATLEEQSTMPVKDAIEMGWSGEAGDPSFDDLIVKLEGLDYYDILFEFAFGDNAITEERIQTALGQFVRSIQSFDSRYDEGRINVMHDSMPFANFTDQENLGKQLFLESVQFGSEGLRVGGGIGCANCHVPPEFSIIENSRTNGVILSWNGFTNDEGVTKSPTLRDVFNPAGELNGQLMHNGLFTSMRQVLEHYNDIEETTGIPNIVLDPRLKNGAHAQRLDMTEEEFDAVEAFLKTLTGNDVYTNPIWSDPFDANGELLVLDNSTSTNDIVETQITVSPNPAVDRVEIGSLDQLTQIDIMTINGQLIKSLTVNNRTKMSIDVSGYNNGTYIVIGKDVHNNSVLAQKFIKL